jgi:glycosyltransferase involved in cell wall biosynthesis
MKTEMMELAEQALISVIVPTHNRPDFLAKTVQSILDQTYHNIELIVVSNGRSLENKSVVESFGDPRIVYTDQENSGGPSAPRNHGIRLAKGVYIAVCDDDDLWLPEKLEMQMLALRRNPIAGMCYTHMTFFDESGLEWSDDRRLADFALLCYRNFVPISSVLVKREVIDQIGGFDEGNQVGVSEDYEFVLRCAYVTKLCFVDEKLVRYWAGENRTTSTDTHRRIRDDISHLKDIWGCFSVVSQKCGIPTSFFIRPFVHYMKICSKSSAYIVCKRLGIR